MSAGERKWRISCERLIWERPLWLRSLFFEVGEEAVEQVCGVGDLEGGVPQAGEEPREVSLEAQECGAEAPVGVAGAARRR